MNTNTTDIKSKKIVAIHLLDNGSVITEKLRNEILDFVTDIPSDLPLDAEYTLQSLCGTDYWSSLTAAERRSAGMYMAYLVREQLVRYEFAGRPCRSPKVYRII